MSIDDSGSLILDLNAGDAVALANRFSFEPLQLPENILNTARVANAVLTVARII